MTNHRGRVLITGASSGIGEAFAQLFASEDFDLILTARRLERLEGLKDRLSDQCDVQIHAADLSTDAGVSSLIAYVAAESLDVDILVNNAGMMVNDEFDKLSEADLLQTLSLNVTALTRLTHHFLQGMVARKSGRVLNVASVAAFHPVPGMDLYAATKAYVLSLTEALSENLKKSGVFLTALCPGLTDTEMAEAAIADVLPPFMISKPEDVAREGFDALMNREVICVPGGANKLALTWAQHQPRWLVRGLGGLASRIAPRS